MAWVARASMPRPAKPARRSLYALRLCGRLTNVERYGPFSIGPDELGAARGRGPAWRSRSWPSSGSVRSPRLRIEGVELVEVAVPADRRARPDRSPGRFQSFTPSRGARRAASATCAFRQAVLRRRNVVDDPVDPRRASEPLDRARRDRRRSAPRLFAFAGTPLQASGGAIRPSPSHVCLLGIAPFGRERGRCEREGHSDILEDPQPRGKTQRARAVRFAPAASGVASGAIRVRARRRAHRPRDQRWIFPPRAARRQRPGSRTPCPARG